MPTTNNNTPYNPTILSSTGVGSAYDDASRRLNDFTSGNDPYALLFDKMTEMNKTTQDNAIASATAKSEREKNATQQNESQYMAGLETSAVQSGANRYLPEYHLGIVEQAKNSYMQKYQTIDAAEKLAIAQATAAKQSGDVKVMQERLDYVDKLRKAKADALEQANQMEWEKYKFEKNYALDLRRENRLSAADAAAAETETERVQTNVLQPTTHQLRRLQNNGVPLDALNYIQAQIAKGYSFEEAFSGLGDAQSQITTKGRNLIKKFIKPI